MTASPGNNTVMKPLWSIAGNILLQLNGLNVHRILQQELAVVARHKSGTINEIYVSFHPWGNKQIDCNTKLYERYGIRSSIKR
jgi:hypothetical protein